MSFSHIEINELYALLRPITVTDGRRRKFTNWGETFACTPLAVFEPETEYHCELVLELARREGKGVRASGVGHSPSDLACTSDFMVRMTRMNKILEVDREKKCVTAQGGITLQDLHERLAEHGLAMSNVGSISEQTLAGIVTTATHGSGISYPVIPSDVQALTVLLADGSRVTCTPSQNTDLFNATICGLGSTGLILSLQLGVEPAFKLREAQETIQFDELLNNLDELVHSSEHTRFWWLAPSNKVRASFLDRTAEPKNPAGNWFIDRFIRHHVIQLALFFGRYFSSLNLLVSHFESWLISSPSVGVDDSWKIFNVNCKYVQHTTEWAVPYEKARACLSECRDWMSEYCKTAKFIPHIAAEIRFSAADDIWLSPSNGHLTCWIGVTLFKPYGFDVPHKELYDGFEQIVLRYDGRPHWAKAHRLESALFREMYPKFDEFKTVLDRFDPRGMFRNEYVQRHIFGKTGPNFDNGKFRIGQTF